MELRFPFHALIQVYCLFPCLHNKNLFSLTEVINPVTVQQHTVKVKVHTEAMSEKLYLTRSRPQLQPSLVSNNPAPRQQKHLST